MVVAVLLTTRASCRLSALSPQDQTPKVRKQSANPIRRRSGVQLSSSGSPRPPHPWRSLLACTSPVQMPVVEAPPAATKKRGSRAGIQPSQPPPREWRSTSAGPRQTCQPDAHRSAALQPVPAVLPLSSPAMEPQVRRSADSRRIPGWSKAPAHPAMSGHDARVRKPSRLPSEQPTLTGGPFVPAGSLASMGSTDPASDQRPSGMDWASPGSEACRCKPPSRVRHPVESTRAKKTVSRRTLQA